MIVPSSMMVELGSRSGAGKRGGAGNSELKYVSCGRVIILFAF